MVNATIRFQNHNIPLLYISKELLLSEHQRDLLSNYACKLHPKN